MSDALSFAEIAGQHVELLPARTVLTSGGYHSNDDGGTVYNNTVTFGNDSPAFTATDASADDSK